MNQQYSEVLLLITVLILFVTLIILQFGNYGDEKILIFKNKGISEGAQGITGMVSGAVSATVFVLGQPPAPNLSVWMHDFGGYSDGTPFLNWTFDNFPNVKEFFLYKKTNFSDPFNFNVPYQTFTNTTFNYIDAAASTQDSVFYTMLANTSYGMVSDYNHYDWGKHTRSLYTTTTNRNINLVSLPLKPVNTSIYAVIIQNPSNYKISQVYRRNDQTGTYLIVDYYDELGIWDGEFYDLVPGYGYWIKVRTPTNFSTVGSTTPQNISWPLYRTPTNRGINLIGWASITSKPIVDVFHNSPSNFNVTQVYRRNDQTGTYLIVDYYDDINLWDGDFYDLEPGYGYWVKTIQNMTMKYEANVV